MRCATHTHRECTDFCIDCKVPLCTLCTYPHDGDPFCVECYAPRRRSRTQIRHAMSAILLCIVLVGSMAFYASQSEVNRRRRLYGAYADEILRLQEILAQDQCNVDATTRAVDLLLESANNTAAQHTARRLVNRCPLTLEGLSTLFFAEKRGLNHRGAAETAGKIIRYAPHRPEGYAYRALAHEASGHLEAAADDFTTAMQLNPQLLDVPINLANVLERLGRHCQAAKPLEHSLGIYPGLENRFEIEGRIDRLRRQGDCMLERLTARTVEVAFDRTNEVIVLDGIVNRQHVGRFIVDTGASSVVISRNLADRAGIKLDPQTSPVFVQTAGGIVDAFPSRLSEITIGGASVRDMPVLVCDTMGKDVDGLLGINFLRRFHVTLDHGTGKITFRNKEGTVVDPIEDWNRSNR